MAYISISSNSSYLNNLYNKPTTYQSSSSLIKQIQDLLNQVFNGYQGLLKEAPKSPNHYANDLAGCYVIETQNYRVYFYGSYSESGSQINGISIFQDKLGTELGLGGTLTYAGLPGLSSLTSASITEVNVIQKSGSNIKHTMTGSSLSLNKETSLLTGTVSNFYSYTENTSTHLTKWNLYDLQTSISINTNKTNSAVAEEGILNTIVFGQDTSTTSPFTTIDSYSVGSIQGWKLSTSASSLALSTSSNDNITKEGSGNSVIKGNSGSDTITASHGNNTISGGLGNDTITGGDGDNLFVFNTAPSSNNVDTITDFHAGDKIQLSRATFKGLAKSLGTDFLLTSTTPVATSKEHLIFNSTDHTLYYNADGSGTKAPIPVVVVGNYDLSLNDISVIS